MIGSLQVNGQGRQPGAGIRAILRRWLSFIGVALVLPASVLIAGCAPKPQQPSSPRLTVEAVDSVLAELGGQLTASLSREQRWRLISSVGTGLPPRGFQLSDLPNPKAYGATMLRVYCEQCHGLPTPLMHSATEWPLLVRRMMLRMRMLQNRLGGPVTTSLVGGFMVDVMKNVATPSPSQVDSLLDYLEANALPVAKPGEVGNTPDAQVFVAKCSVCHQTPSPSAHTAAEWPEVIARMQSNMAQMGVTQLTVDEVAQVAAYLKAHAAGGK